MAYVLDRTRMPLVVLRCEGRIDDDAYAAHLRAYGDLLGVGQRFGMVVDARAAEAIPWSQRRMQSAFLTDHAETFTRLCVGEAFVITSPLVRAALKAVLFFAPPPHPYAVVSTVEQGTAWIRARLDEVGSTETARLG